MKEKQYQCIRYALPAKINILYRMVVKVAGMTVKVARLTEQNTFNNAWVSLPLFLNLTHLAAWNVLLRSPEPLLRLTLRPSLFLHVGVRVDLLRRRDARVDFILLKYLLQRSC